MVTDAKGASTNRLTNVITIGSMTGTWGGNSPAITGRFEMRLTQIGGFITGTFSHPQGTGGIEPSRPGTITLSGRVTLRVKVNGPYDTFTLSGQMDQSGRLIAGTINGSGFNGALFTLSK